MTIFVKLDRMMENRGMGVKELAGLIDIPIARIDRLRLGNISAVRLSTIDRMCEVLCCQPGDLLEYSQSEHLHDAQ